MASYIDVGIAVIVVVGDGDFLTVTFWLESNTRRDVFKTAVS